MSSVRIWVSRYELKPVGSLNRLASASAHGGALLKIETAEGFGYADLHPWPELGDLALEAQLASLRTGPSALAARSLGLAQIDAHARGERMSVFAGQELPLNHFLISDLVNATHATFEKSWAAGFRYLKIKLGRDLVSELAAISKFAEDLSAFKLRFDFNGALTAETFLSFVGAWPDSVRRVVEFVEDPCAFSPSAWTSLEERGGLSLALDRWPSGTFEPRGFSWLIVKPALQDPSAMTELAERAGARVALTSYMDHPLGQVSAAWEASRVRARGVCGLLSQNSYEPTEYAERLAKGPLFTSPGGTGFGFDDLLDHETWAPL